MTNPSINHAESERARRKALDVLLANHVAVELQDDLFVFAFADLVGRLEIMTNASANTAHAHMTLSSPEFTCPVLDCWIGRAHDDVPALEAAIEQWASGALWAYHDALCHQEEPPYTIDANGMQWHAYESPMQSTGASDATFERVFALQLTAGALSCL